MDDVLLEMKGICKSFNGNPVLEDVAFTSAAARSTL